MASGVVDLGAPKKLERTTQEVKMPAARPSEKNAAETMEDANRKLSEGVTQTAQRTAEASERAARAGADMLQRNAEIMQQAWEVSSTMAAQLTQRSADQVARALGLSGDEAKNAAQQSSANVEAIIGSSTLIAESLQSISREWMEFARSRLERNLARFDELARCRTPQDLAAVQSEAVRDNLEGALRSARRTAEISARAVDGAMKNLTQRARQAA
jgi:phasin family protein